MVSEHFGTNGHLSVYFPQSILNNALTDFPRKYVKKF